MTAELKNSIQVDIKINVVQFYKGNWILLSESITQAVHDISDWVDLYQLGGAIHRPNRYTHTHAQCIYICMYNINDSIRAALTWFLGNKSTETWRPCTQNRAIKKYYNKRNISDEKLPKIFLFLKILLGFAALNWFFRPFFLLKKKAQINQKVFRINLSNFVFFS